MKLTILSASGPSFGKYSCVAKNPRGQTDGSITLYGQPPALSPARAPSQPHSTILSRVINLP
jgi:hypothetical protein